MVFIRYGIGHGIDGLHFAKERRDAMRPLLNYRAVLGVWQTDR
jgi:hypothetical protein